MLATALSILLAAPGVSPQALEVILRAQSAQAGKPYRARFQISNRSSGESSTAKLVVVPPDRLWVLDQGPLPMQSIQIGDRAWMQSGGEDWQPHPLPDLRAAPARRCW